MGGCASTRLAPLTSQTEPGLLDADEQKLWATADRLEAEITAKVKPAVSHEPVEKYLAEVLTRLTPDFNNPNVRVRIRVLPDPNPNAFVLPNGAMYVNSGLLALLENEAQIAAVLGHEFYHFKNRHSCRERIKEHNALVTGVIVGSALGGLAGTAELWQISSVSGYSQRLESEADRESLFAMMKAGYEGEQAIKAFERLQSVSKEEKGREVERFTAHPKLSDRIASYRKGLRGPETQQYASGARVAQDPYSEKIFETVLDNVALNLDEDNYDVAGNDIERCLRLKPECARAHFLRGELLRTGPSTDADVWQHALDCYGRSIQCDPSFAEAYREIGLLRRQLNDRAGAGESLQKYLTMAGEAVDSPIVKSYLDRLGDTSDTIAPPYRAPQITEKDFREKVKTLGMMPMVIPGGISSADKKKEEFEAALVKNLEAGGYRVVPSSAFKTRYDAIRKLVGAVYDPNTGERVEGRHDIVVDHVRREYLAAHKIDALVYPAIAVVSAHWSANRAEWHGTHAATTGKEGLWAALAAPSAYGTIPALSFRLLITSTYGEACFLGFGGMELCSRVSGGGFVGVPAHELLVDPAKNVKSVEIACRVLAGETQ